MRIASRLGMSHLRHQHMSATAEAELEAEAMSAHPADFRDVVAAVGFCPARLLLGLDGWAPGLRACLRSAHLLHITTGSWKAQYVINLEVLGQSRGAFQS